MFKLGKQVTHVLSKGPNEIVVNNHIFLPTNLEEIILDVNSMMMVDGTVGFIWIVSLLSRLPK